MFSDSNDIVLFDNAMARLPRSLADAKSKYLYFMYSEMYPHKVRGYINKERNPQNI